MHSATRFVNNHCAGKRIVSVEVREQGGGPLDGKVDDKVLAAGPDALRDALHNNTLVTMHRHGKYMWWEMDSGKSVSFHFAMSGSFKIQGKRSLK